MCVYTFIYLCICVYGYMHAYQSYQQQNKCEYVYMCPALHNIYDT